MADDINIDGMHLSFRDDDAHAFISAKDKIYLSLVPGLQHAELAAAMLIGEGFVTLNVPGVTASPDYAGRLWKELSVVAFWNWCTSGDDLSVAKRVAEAVAERLGVEDELQFWIVEENESSIFGTDTLVPIGELSGTGNSGPGRKAELMRLQHLNPDIKRVLGAEPGSRVAQRKAAAGGFDSPAQWNAAKIIGDSVN